MMHQLVPLSSTLVRPLRIEFSVQPVWLEGGLTAPLHLAIEKSLR